MEFNPAGLPDQWGHWLLIRGQITTDRTTGEPPRQTESHPVTTDDRLWPGNEPRRLPRYEARSGAVCRMSRCLMRRRMLSRQRYCRQLLTPKRFATDLLNGVGALRIS